MKFNKHLILIMAVIISLGLSQGVFADTSTAWNDSTAGELSYSGKVGIGTTGPLGKLHVAGVVVADEFRTDGGNLRLSGSGWGVEVLLDTDGGSSDYFVIKDTGVEKFRVVGNTGNVGIGTPSPNQRLHMASTSPTIRLEDKDQTGAGKNYWIHNNSGRLYFLQDRDGDGDWEGPYPLVIAASGSVGIGTTDPGTAKLKVAGSIVATGTVTTGSSRTLKKDIEPISNTEATLALMALDPVSFRYKADDTELNIGFIAEDVPDMVATNDRKGLNSMDLVTLAITVIQDQQKEMENQQKEIDALKQEMKNLKN